MEKAEEDEEVSEKRKASISEDALLFSVTWAPMYKNCQTIGLSFSQKTWIVLAYLKAAQIFCCSSCFYNEDVNIAFNYYRALAYSTWNGLFPECVPELIWKA